MAAEGPQLSLRLLFLDVFSVLSCRALWPGTLTSIRAAVPFAFSLSLPGDPGTGPESRGEHGLVSDALLLCHALLQPLPESLPQTFSGQDLSLRDVTPQQMLLLR